MNYTELPTRITAASSTLIDVRLLNLNENNMRLGALTADVGEHLHVVCVTNTVFQKEKEGHGARICRGIKDPTLEQFRYLLSGEEW